MLFTCILLLSALTCLATDFPHPTNVAYQADYLADVPVDHVGYGTTDTFTLKYLYNNASYAPGGPIFFYAGNEGQVELFANNTGIMYDLAPLFNAMLVFGEHRYYGESLPYGANTSFADMQHLQYLTSIQALADYVLLLGNIKEKFGLGADTPVVVFGGSYGGLLSAWFRMKYPSVVRGAWSAAGPVRMFYPTDLPLDGWAAVVKNTLLECGCDEATVTASLAAITNLAATDDGRQKLNDIFLLDDRSQITSAVGAGWLLSYVQMALQSVSEINYPYPSDFFAPMPGWPAVATCLHLSGNLTSNDTDEVLAGRLHDAINVYYNYTGQLEKACIDPMNCGGTTAVSGTFITFAWYFQYCSEVALGNLFG